MTLEDLERLARDAILHPEWSTNRHFVSLKIPHPGKIHTRNINVFGRNGLRGLVVGGDMSHVFVFVKAEAILKFMKRIKKNWSMVQWLPGIEHVAPESKIKMGRVSLRGSDFGYDD